MINQRIIQYIRYPIFFEKVTTTPYLLIEKSINQRKASNIVILTNSGIIL